MKYFLTRVYDDYTTMSESSDDITALLGAAAIYLKDTSCIHLGIDEWDGEYYSKRIMCYERP